MNTLLNMRKCVSGGPATAKTTGSAPAPTNIAVIPPTSDDSVLISLSYLNDMASMISLYSAIYAMNLQKRRNSAEQSSPTGSQIQEKQLRHSQIKPTQHTSL